MTDPATPAAARVERWQGVRRLLAVRLDNLGDVLMTTPALAALHESLPQTHITLLASPSGAAAAAHLPMVDEAWAFSAPWMGHAVAGAAGSVAGGGKAAAPRNGLGHAEAALIDRLSEARFDAAVIFTVCTQSALPAALLCRLAGIPLRLAHCRENPYALLTDWVPDTDTIASGMRHEVLRQLALVAAVGLHTHDDRLRFAVRAADRPRVAEQLGAAGLAGRPYVVLHPGATAASRRWPAAFFGAAAATLAASSDCAMVFSGDGGDLVHVDQALQTMRAAAGAGAAISLAGALNLGELAVLIEGAQVLVSNNSAPAHLAAALGTPTVNLYALTNPQHTPWRVRAEVLSHDVPCRWCLKSTCPQQHHDCLRRVQPAQVVSATLGLLRDGRTARMPAPAPTPTPATLERHA